MALLREWFPEFAAALVERTGRADFPEAGSEYWSDWRREFAREGVQWEEADLACSRVCSIPNVFMPDYRPLIVAEAKKIRAERPSERPGLSALEDARLASKACPDCLGNGSAVRFVHAEILGGFRTALGADVPVGSAFSLPCSCPLGRHVARGLAKEGRPAPPTVDQYPSLRRWAAPWGSAVPDGLDNQFAHRPDDWDSLHGCPIPDPEATYDLDQLKDFVRKVAVEPAEGHSSRQWSDRTTVARDRVREAYKPSPGRPELVPAAADPIVARELAGIAPDRPPVAAPQTPAPPVAVTVEDDTPWF